VLLAVVLGLAGVVVLTAGPAAGVDQVEPDGALDDENTTFGTTVYTGSEDGTVLAVDVDGGTTELVWETDVGGTVGTPDDRLLYQSAPTAADGTVYVTSQTDVGSGTRGNLTALDAETGAIEWRFSDTGFVPDGSPTIIDGVVYVTSVFGDVYAVDADTGNRVWEASVPTNSSEDATLKSAPTVVNGTVYVTEFGNNKFNLYALDADTGEQR
jgi:FOG: WD40-like repeat